MTAISELPLDRISRARPLFASARFDVAYIDAVFDGVQPGRIFVDDPARPASALLTRTYDYYLAGTPAPAMRAFLRDAPGEAGVFAELYGYVPLTGAWESPMLGYVPLEHEWDRALTADFGDRLVRWGRRSFQLVPPRAGSASDRRDRGPTGVEVVPLTRTLAERVDRELNELIGMFWAGYERFGEHGFGACALIDGAPASVCFAIGLSRSHVDLGVATAVAHRRRGLASVVCRTAIDEALDCGLIPTWDCDEVNAASAALALRLGFVEGPRFAELAFPNRVKPMLSDGLWRASTAASGINRWDRVEANP